MKANFDHYFKEIVRSPVYDVAIESPIEKAQKLSTSLGNEILLKREDRQSVFSFKLRGAYHRVYHLSEQQRQHGVICSSAGNHAQGLALAAKKLGVSAKIVMPKTTPSIKVSAVKNLGAAVVLEGDNYDAAFLHAKQLQQQEKRTFVPAFDDDMVICGQGTIGMEIVRQSAGQLPHMVFLPVGGGGLAAGVSLFIKQLAPEVKIIAVEPEDAACLQAAMQAGRRVVLDEVGLFADGVAVAQIGEKPWHILQHTVDEVVTVNSDEMCAAIKDCFEQTRTVVEPAGALALAGLKRKVLRDGISEQRLMCIISGANMNFDRLQYVAERAEVGENREAILGVTIAEKPGSFLRFCKLIGKTIISEFNYRYNDAEQAHIFVGVKLTQTTHRQQLIERLQKNGYPVIDLSQDELAKSHIRHMVGGRAAGVDDERLFRFNFPERPGALLEFLQLIASTCNISLFHYRNHGAAYGRVLVGLQLSTQQQLDFIKQVRSLGLEPYDETNNQAYRLFCLASAD